MMVLKWPGPVSQWKLAHRPGWLMERAYSSGEGRAKRQEDKKYGKEGDSLFNRHYRNQEMGLNVFFLVLAISAGHKGSIGRRTGGKSSGLRPIKCTGPYRRPGNEWVCGLWEGTGPRNGFGLGFWLLDAVDVKLMFNLI